MTVYWFSSNNTVTRRFCTIFSEAAFQSLSYHSLLYVPRNSMSVTELTCSALHYSLKENAKGRPALVPLGTYSSR